MSPYHGAKLSSFMSPHHSMASSSGEFFTVFPSANTLTCRQSINISLNSNFPPSAIAPDGDSCKACKSIKIKFSNQFPIVIRLSVSWCLAGASQFDRRPIIVRHCVSDFRSGPFFDGRNLKGSPLGNMNFPGLFPHFFRFTLSSLITPSQRGAFNQTPSIYFIMNASIHSATPLSIHCCSMRASFFSFID